LDIDLLNGHKFKDEQDMATYSGIPYSEDTTLVYFLCRAAALAWVQRAVEKSFQLADETLAA